MMQNVVPNSKKKCGPYEPKSLNDINKSSLTYFNTNEDKYYSKFKFGPENHDTIGMIVIDQNNNIAAGTSTNGATYKIPG